MNDFTKIDLSKIDFRDLELKTTLDDHQRAFQTAFYELVMNLDGQGLLFPGPVSEEQVKKLDLGPDSEGFSGLYDTDLVTTIGQNTSAFSSGLTKNAEAMLVFFSEDTRTSQTLVFETDFDLQKTIEVLSDLRNNLPTLRNILNARKEPVNECNAEATAPEKAVAIPKLDTPLSWANCRMLRLLEAALYNPIVGVDPSICYAVRNDVQMTLAKMAEGVMPTKVCAAGLLCVIAVASAPPAEDDSFGKYVERLTGISSGTNADVWSYLFGTTATKGLDNFGLAERVSLIAEQAEALR